MRNVTLVTVLEPSLLLLCVDGYDLGEENDPGKKRFGLILQLEYSAS